MKRPQFFSIAIAAVCALQVQGAVAAPDEPRSKVVAFADLDLSRPADTAALYRRIERAAVAVCETVNARDLAQIAHLRACVAAVVAQAVADTRAPRLAEYYAMLTGKPILSPPVAPLKGNAGPG